jgi:LacI family transcriptional regulator
VLTTRLNRATLLTTQLRKRFSEVSLQQFMASIRDVAQLAEVSTATVSHVLNGTRYVSPKLTERVETAMAELNYQPDAVAQSLRRRRTLTLGLLVPSVEIPFFASVAYSIERSATAQGYNIILCNSNWHMPTEEDHLRDLLARRVDGLICISASMTAAEIGPVIEGGTPVVMFERQMPDIGLDAVGIDNNLGAYEATKHLLHLGHRRIAAIRGMPISTVSDERVRGYRRALEEAGVAFDEALVYAGDFQPQTGYEATERFLALAQRPTAIFAFNDLMAMGVMHRLTQAQLHVPQDVAVVGFDDTPLSQYMSPSLTTVRQPLMEMGQRAVELLLQRIADEGPERAQYVRFEPELIVRASTVGTLDMMP